MDITVALLGMLARRLPFSVPTPKGFVALKEGGRAAVYPYLAGRPLELTHLPAGPGLAAEIGRAIAALHNVDRQLFDEAGLPSYDADTYRTRRLSELDRAAATGHVPTGLLARWEAAAGGRVAVAVRADARPTGTSAASRSWPSSTTTRTLRPAGSGPSPAGRTRRWPTPPTTSPPWSPRPHRRRSTRCWRPTPTRGWTAPTRTSSAAPVWPVSCAWSARCWPPPPAHRAPTRARSRRCAARLRRLDEHAADHPLTEPKVVRAVACRGLRPTVAAVPPVVVDDADRRRRTRRRPPRGDAAEAVTTDEPIDTTVPSHADTAAPTGEVPQAVAPDAPEQAEPHDHGAADAAARAGGSTATGSAGDVAPGGRGDAPAAGQPAPEHHAEDDDLDPADPRATALRGPAQQLTRGRTGGDSVGEGRQQPDQLGLVGQLWPHASRRCRRSRTPRRPARGSSPRSRANASR